MQTVHHFLLGPSQKCLRRICHDVCHPNLRSGDQTRDANSHLRLGILAPVGYTHPTHADSLQAVIGNKQNFKNEDLLLKYLQRIEQNSRLILSSVVVVIVKKR